MQGYTLRTYEYNKTFRYERKFNYSILQWVRQLQVILNNFICWITIGILVFLQQFAYVHAKKII